MVMCSRIQIVVVDIGVHVLDISGVEIDGHDDLVLGVVGGVAIVVDVVVVRLVLRAGILIRLLIIVSSLSRIVQQIGSRSWN